MSSVRDGFEPFARRASATPSESGVPSGDPPPTPTVRALQKGPLAGLESSPSSPETHEGQAHVPRAHARALPPGKRFVQIEGTYAEHKVRAQRLLGDHFDEHAFRSAVFAVSADPIERARAVDEHIWTRLPALPGGTLKLIGRGYAQAAYTNGDDTPKEVIKINMFAMFQAAQWQSLFGRSGHDEIPASTWGEGERYAQQENAAYREMADYFPDGSVPELTATVEKVAVRGDVLAFLLQRRAAYDDRRAMPVLNADEIYHVPALVRTQAFVPAAARKDTLHFSLSWRNLEEIGISPKKRELYRMAGEAWVLNRTRDFNERAFRYCVSGTKLEALYLACGHDARLRDRVRDFVSRSIDYLNDKRTFLDIGGDGNAIFDEDGYVLPDVFPGIVRAAEIAQRTLEQISYREPIGNLDRRRTVFALNDFRAFNAMAHALGISARAELISSAALKRSLDWDRIAAALRPFVKRPQQRASLEHVEPVVFPVPHGPWGF